MAKNSKDLISWLNYSISEEHIRYYEYSDFTNIQQIGKGSYGNVACVNWKNSNRLFAIKSFNNKEETIKEVVKELKLHRSVDDHENIIRFYGITRMEDTTHQTNKYSLVLEYANNGTLNTYLNEHFDELNWNGKYRLALQLTSAIEFLHEKNIIHRDLHAGNILVHQGSIKLAEFGLSKKIAEASSNTSKILGIYWVIMWQISSGCEPFKSKGFDYDACLILSILNGNREEIIDGTSVEYNKLYTDDYENELIVEFENSSPSASNKIRTSIDDTYLKIEKDKFINNDYEKEDLEKHESISKSSKRTIDINNDLINDLESLNIGEFEYKSVAIIDSENSPLGISNQTTEPSTEDTNICRNQLFLKLENEGFITPDEKVKEIIKELIEPKFLYALKLLFENLQNKFSSQILVSSLKSLANPTLFDYYSEENVARLELHLRTWIAVLERIHFSNPPIVLSKDLLGKVCNSLAKFAEIYYKTIQVVDRSNFNQQKDKKYNYNIDFLLTHLRDTLCSLCDNETWFQGLLRRIKDLLNTILNITPSSKVAPISDENYSIESMITKLRQGLNSKYSVPSYYIDWRIMLVIQHNISIWSESSEGIINKKFAEMLLMEYIWSFLEREWNNVTEKSILDSQVKFDEVSNKVSKTLRNTGNFLSNLTDNEPLVLPHILWFGILDLALKLIQKSTRTATYGLCYYLTIESLNKAPSNFIQFKVIEILLHLHNIDNQTFSMIEDDFNQFVQRLKKYLEDRKILNDIDKEKGKGKGKSLNQNAIYLNKQISNSSNIIDVIAGEITCPISSEPTDQLCILKCQHILSLNNLKKLKQKRCPICREKLENNNVRYLPQNTIYKNLYSQFFKAGYILSTDELENSEQITNDQYDNDSDNTEVDLILTKKKKFMKAIKLNSNIFSSILPKISRKQHPIYLNIIKELNGKYYHKAEYLCKEFLELFPESYSVRCILAYIYRCLKNYKQAHLYLKEAIELKPKKPIAYFICGEIFILQNEYDKALNNLNVLLEYKIKPSNLHTIIRNSYFYNYSIFNCNNPIFSYNNALENYNIALKSDPNNNLYLKNCAYIFQKQEDYVNCLRMLNRLLNINDEDSLILCYYGEILKYLGKYKEAVRYFTKANIIDPENIHNLNKRAIAYFILQEYNKALIDLGKVIQLDPSNSLAYYNKGLIYYTIGNIEDALVAFKKCLELDSNDNLSRIQLFYMEYLQEKNSKNSCDIKYDIRAKVEQIYYDDNDYSSRFMKYKIYIDLFIMDSKEYFIESTFSLLDTNLLFNEKVSFFYLLRSMKYSNFWSEAWSYVCKRYGAYDNLNALGIIDPFCKFIYEMMKVYFISNCINLNNEFHQFQIIATNSLSGRILSFKDRTFSFNLPKLPKLPQFFTHWRCVIWKINVKKIIVSKECFIKFITKQERSFESVQDEHILKYDDVSKLEGLGWIEYSFNISKTKSKWVLPSIEVNGLNMVYYYFI
ncbi:hypothetical protein RclHR1_00780024 [Rhizophagus clarus]|uniref:Protein kinase domain-containing protein n=1 Tax=Rhizophagus clarus TaxID=94130 RepID=A0A2Z6RYH9_9GLOM|nr:hypothetical protein RclHR1_00780024 [Rhizophagus clarus]